MKKYLIILFSLSVSKSFFSQRSTAGNWLIYDGNQQINEKWNWRNEAQYHHHRLKGDLQQLLLQNGFGYNLTENNNNVLIGHAFRNAQRNLPSAFQKCFRYSVSLNTLIKNKNINGIITYTSIHHEISLNMCGSIIDLNRIHSG